MAKVSVKTLDKAPIVPAPEGALGGVETRAFYDRADQPLHMHLHQLEPGASLRIEGTPTDQLFYVWKGTAEAGGIELDPRSSMIVERGASQEVRAGDDGATLVAFCSKELPERPRAGGHVHLLPYDAVPRTTDLGNGKAGGALHADAHCPTCELWLHENDFYAGGGETVLHSHSESEIIFVRDGAIVLGNRVYGPGTALAVEANVKYGFLSGPDGLSFINFRASSPTYTSADGSLTLDEAKFWRGKAGIPQYLEPLAS